MQSSSAIASVLIARNVSSLSLLADSIVALEWIGLSDGLPFNPANSSCSVDVVFFC
jgi:hypothetical protein